MNLLEDRIQALEDRENIKEAVAKYSLYILTDEASKIPSLFADDGVFRIDSAGLMLAGREALTAFFSRMTAGSTYPFVQTTAISLDGDAASHIGVMDNPSHVEGHKGYLGIYYDKLCRIGGRWLFTDRSFTFVQGGPPPLRRP